MRETFEAGWELELSGPGLGPGPDRWEHVLDRAEREVAGWVLMTFQDCQMHAQVALLGLPPLFLQKARPHGVGHDQSSSGFSGLGPCFLSQGSNLPITGYALPLAAVQTYAALRDLCLDFRNESLNYVAWCGRW